MEILTFDFYQQLQINMIRWINTKLLSDGRNENSNTEDLHKHKDDTQ